jgi:16S rRNA (guanine527-N7)-methyltransferase
MTIVARNSVAGLGVSRETFERLEAFVALVKRWNPAINLISKSAVRDIWGRHIIDSAQLFAFCPPSANRWIDIGSGGGFPGLVIAILAKEALPDLRVTLVESDQRKATFLRQAAQSLDLSVTVLGNRVETVPALEGDVISARALAPLGELFHLVDGHVCHDGVALFAKGARYALELDEARKDWRFDVTVHPSISDPAAAILEIRNIYREH